MTLKDDLAVHIITFVLFSEEPKESSPSSVLRRNLLRMGTSPITAGLFTAPRHAGSTASLSST